MNKLVWKLGDGQMLTLQTAVLVWDIAALQLPLTATLLRAAVPPAVSRATGASTPWYTSGRICHISLNEWFKLMPFSPPSRNNTGEQHTNPVQGQAVEAWGGGVRRRLTEGCGRWLGSVTPSSWVQRKGLVHRFWLCSCSHRKITL